MFYLTEITTYNNGKNSEKAVYDIDDKITAIGKYHQKMGNMMLSEIVATEQLILTDDNNVVIKREPTFVRPVPTPEPEPTPEIPEIPEIPEEQA